MAPAMNVCDPDGCYSMPYIIGEIKSRLLPFAVTCGCGGLDEDCARVLNDPIWQARIAQIADVVELLQRIAQADR